MNLDRFKEPNNEAPIRHEPETEPRDSEHYRELLNRRCRENAELLKGVLQVMDAQRREQSEALAKSLTVLLDMTHKALEK